MNILDSAKTIKIGKNEYENTGINIRINGVVYKTILDLCRGIKVLDQDFLEDVQWLMSKYFMNSDYYLHDDKAEFSSQKAYNNFVSCIKTAAYLYIGYIDTEDLTYLNCIAKSGSNKDRRAPNLMDKAISWITNKSDYGVSYVTIGEYLGFTPFRAWDLFNKLKENNVESRYDNIPVQINNDKYKSLIEAESKTHIGLGLLRRAIAYSIEKQKLDVYDIKNLDITFSINHEFFKEYSLVYVHNHTVGLVTSENEFNEACTKIKMLTRLNYYRGKYYSYFSTYGDGDCYFVVKSRLKDKFKISLGDSVDSIVNVNNHRQIGIIAKQLGLDFANMKAALLASSEYYKDEVVDIGLGYMLLGNYYANGRVYKNIDDIIRGQSQGYVPKYWFDDIKNSDTPVGYFNISVVPKKPAYYDFGVRVGYIYNVLVMANSLMDSFITQSPLEKIDRLWTGCGYAIYDVIKHLYGTRYDDTIEFANKIKLIKELILRSENKDAQKEEKKAKAEKKKASTKKSETIVIGRKVYKSIAEALKAYGIDTIPHKTMYNQFRNEPTAFCCFCIAEKIGLANYEAIKQTRVKSQLAYMKNCIIIVNESINKN